MDTGHSKGLEISPLILEICLDTQLTIYSCGIGFVGKIEAGTHYDLYGKKKLIFPVKMLPTNPFYKASIHYSIVRIILWLMVMNHVLACSWTLGSGIAGLEIAGDCGGDCGDGTRNQWVNEFDHFLHHYPVDGFKIHRDPAPKVDYL